MPDLTPEALAAKLETDAKAAINAAGEADAKGARQLASYHRGQHDACTGLAMQLRDRLAPAHAALAAEVVTARQNAAYHESVVLTVTAERDELRALIGASQPALASELLAERAANARLAAQRDEAREQLATTLAIARMLQALAIEILGSFSPASVVGGVTKGDMVALIGPAQLAKWRARAGLGDGQ